MADLVNKQQPQIPQPQEAIEIDKAIYEINLALITKLSWLDNGYGRAYRNLHQKRGRGYYPEVYLGNVNGSERYHEVTPDDDIKASVFFYVANQQMLNFEPSTLNVMQFPLAIIFNANLELIDDTLLNTDYFQQKLISEVRQVLSRDLPPGYRNLTIDSIVTNFNEVYQEFSVTEKYGHNRAPLTTFRFNCTLTIHENCETSLNVCEALNNNVTVEEKQRCILPSMDWSLSETYQYLSTQDIDDMIEYLYGTPTTNVFLKALFSINNNEMEELVVDTDNAGTYTSIEDDGLSGLITLNINGTGDNPFVNPTVLEVGDTVVVKREFVDYSGYVKLIGDAS